MVSPVPSRARKDAHRGFCTRCAQSYKKAEAGGRVGLCKLSLLEQEELGEFMSHSEQAHGDRHHCKGPKAGLVQIGEPRPIDYWKSMEELHQGPRLTGEFPGGFPSAYGLHARRGGTLWMPRASAECHSFVSGIG